MGRTRGQSPAKPPKQSCMKQSQTIPRPTKFATSDARKKMGEDLEEKLNKINNYQNFVKEIGSHVAHFRFITNGKELTMFMTDTLGKKVIQFLHFREVESTFGYLQLLSAEKNGFEVPKNKFELQKNNLFHKWSQLSDIISVLNCYCPLNTDYLSKAMKELNKIEELHDTPNFQFILEQLELLLQQVNGRRYTKHIIILAAELLCISPAAYRMLRNSKAIILPREKFIRELMSKSYQDNNLAKLFETLKPQQRFVNILFDEVKLKKAMRFTGGAYSWSCS